MSGVWTESEEYGHNKIGRMKSEAYILVRDLWYVL